MINIEKLDRLTKLLAAEKALNEYAIFNDLRAKLMDEAKELGKELGADVDKGGQAASMGEKPQGDPNTRRA